MKFEIGKKYLIRNGKGDVIDYPILDICFPAGIRNRKYAIGTIIQIRKDIGDVLIDFGKDIGGHSGDGRLLSKGYPSHVNSCWYIRKEQIIKRHEESDLEKYLWEDVL